MNYDYRSFLAIGCCQLAAVFLCVYTVRDKLKLPLSRALVYGGALMLAYAALMACFDGLWYNLLVGPFLALCFYCYSRIVEERPGKLLFLLLIVASYICFADVIAVTFDVPELDGAGLMSAELTACYVGAILVTVYPVALLLGRMWHTIADLEAAEWNTLWIIPLIFCAMVLILTGAFEEPFIFSWYYRASAFVLAVGAFASYYLLTRMLGSTAQSARDREHVRMMERLLQRQREQYGRLEHSIEDTRRLRHDMRHMLTVVNSYAQAGDAKGLEAYLSDMLGALPVDGDELALCRNYAVNAVARHYVALAKANGIRVDTQLEIPERPLRVPDLDLCVLIGNCLENAVEAACRMEEGERYIHLRAFTQGDYLTIAMDNSFDGVCRVVDGALHSRKREGEGVGLSSIQTIARKYGGYASFQPHGHVFETSVVVRVSDKSQCGDLRKSASGRS